MNVTIIRCEQMTFEPLLLVARHRWQLKDDSRGYNLRVIHIEEKGPNGLPVAVGTDGRRLAIYENERLQLSPGNYSIEKLTKTQLYLGLIETDESFPNWRKFISDEPAKTPYTMDLHVPLNSPISHWAGEVIKLIRKGVNINPDYFHDIKDHSWNVSIPSDPTKAVRFDDKDAGLTVIIMPIDLKDRPVIESLRHDIYC